tara:strand:- start:447 stop:605 length:159 start_codon:yes stop_codon:yes gene_type:complete
LQNIPEKGNFNNGESSFDSSSIKKKKKAPTDWPLSQSLKYPQIDEASRKHGK